jgi:hypothetical protein
MSRNVHSFEISYISFLLLQIVTSVQATANHTDITKIESDTGWVSSPDGRGTIDIISSCLSTLIICVWTCLHLNAPLHGEKERWVILRKLKWGLLMAVAPEVVTTVAWRQFQRAWIHSLSMRSFGYGYWSLSHAFAVDMGTIKLRYKGENEAWAVTQLDFQDCARDGILSLKRSDELENNLLPELHPLKAEELSDKSKADHFTKAIACVQVFWLAVQIVGRASQKLPITTLEFATAAYVANALLVYALWWYKPLDVRYPIVVDILSKGKGLPRLARIPMISTRTEDPANDIALVKRAAGPGLGDRVMRNVICRPQIWNFIFLAAMSAVFAGLHLAAWNDHFPSMAEKYGWRACTLYTLATSTIIFPIYLRSMDIPVDHVENSEQVKTPTPKDLEANKKVTPVVDVNDCKSRTTKFNGKYGLQFIPGVIIIGLYSLARAFLIIEPFVGLRSLPPAAFQTVEWINYLPHF